ncbi:AAA family ATPase [Labilibaculum manganireducens]|uniref:AAA family ATPase n=1 Tax=Labilibaculum manganireducens TaxID=1940525 RepID=A0A2N3IET0_9BACT|nr:ATP-binding protein [Labilibaculum manganireducens]PKQ68788.1 AAA family ATPase [Labilibaculum manganireducens]
MSQADYIKDIARFGLENDQDQLLEVLSKLIEHSRQTKKVNLALQLQSILKEGLRAQQTKGLATVGSKKYYLKEDDRALNELIIEKLTSDYSFENLVCSAGIKEELTYFVQEHRDIELLNKFDLPVSNRILFHGPSGCGKTLASYVLAGELDMMMYVVNLGAIVSSKLGETSKNLSKLFRQAASENCIIFFDEFDSIGKVRDYSQDHGEMKRVVNTILQLFDYLPQNSIVIAATNQMQMIDEALLRRFDMKINLGLPTNAQIQELIEKTLAKSPFKFRTKKELSEIIKLSEGLSFYLIQRSIITAIKRTLFGLKDLEKPNLYLDSAILKELILKEKV